MTENTRLIISSSDRVFERSIAPQELEPAAIWTASPPIPGARIIGCWELYNLQKTLLVVTESGHYQTFWSPNMEKFTKTHDHESEIYNIYYIDEGMAVFSASDGWWYTHSSGVAWSYLDDGVAAKAAIVIPYDDEEWVIVAYGVDKKIYVRHYPVGTWSEVYDTTSIWAGKRYPTISGSAPGILIGVGPYLIRTGTLGSSWEVVQDFSPSIVKNVIVSGQTKVPVFAIETEADGKSEVCWTSDLGDTVTPDEKRFAVSLGAQSVIPTGETDQINTFVVLGRRTPSSGVVYDIKWGNERTGAGG